MEQRLPAGATPSPAAHANRRLAGLVSLLTSLSLLALGDARAATPADAPPHGGVVTDLMQFELRSIYLLPADGLRHANAANSSARDVGAASASDTPGFLVAGSGRSPRASLVEMPAEVIPGRYTRPKYALGFRSNGMKKFAQSIGLDAHTCLAPLVRARINFSQDGDAGGRLMLFARCSLH
jgi:hypothetical protein